MEIWLTDDDRAVRASLTLLLKRGGYTVRAFGNPTELFAALEKETPALLLLDMNFTVDTSGRRGISTLRAINAMHPALPVILMTGWATVQLAVEGMKLGAKDFIAKPWDNKSLLASIKSVLAVESLGKNQVREEKAPLGFDHIIGESPNLLQLLQTAKNIAKTDASVLILGESGTGKELIAEAIHHESLRADKPFVKVNLGGISESLFESEMFGHKRGAFTDAAFDREGRFATADSGTIFLDEIGDLAAAGQVKLLRVLQEKTYEVLGDSRPRRADVRVISATHKNLSELIAEGKFREDLYYRINLITLTLPALRDRRSDIPLLAKSFIANLAKIYGKEDLRITRAAQDWLQNQDFPGNIRQLKNLTERTVLISNKSTLDIADFQQQLRGTAATATKNSLPPVGDVSLEEMEKQMIAKALKFHDFHISNTARSLGITRSSLYRRMEKFDIKV